MKQRELKFRFWSGTKMFFDLENVLECLKQQSAFDSGAMLPIPYDHVGQHGAAFMQFTGLKDKEGKEIYESDILECKKKGDNFPLRWVVVFNDEQLGFRLRWEDRYVRNEGGFYDIVPSLDQYDIFKVIGDIFSTPELLTKTP